MTEAEITGLKRKSEEGKARDKLYQKLARRAHSRLELRQYLQRKQYDDELIEALLDEFADRGYIDDAAFAAVWVEERRKLKQRSQRALQAELRAKGVAKEIIDEVLTESGEDEQAALRDLFEKKRHLSQYKDERKLMAFLVRRGFSYDAVKNVMSQPEE